MPLDNITYRRAELYEQVWKEPVRDVARKYGISDVWLAKVCRKLAVPRPPRGYWIRKRNGWPEKQLPLTPAPEGKPLEITVPRRMLLEGSSFHRKANFAKSRNKKSALVPHMPEE
jgi:hypothetical protein